MKDRKAALEMAQEIGGDSHSIYSLKGARRIFKAFGLDYSPRGATFISDSTGLKTPSAYGVKDGAKFTGVDSLDVLKIICDKYGIAYETPFYGRGSNYRHVLAALYKAVELWPESADKEAAQA